MSPMRDHAYRKCVQTVSSKPTLSVDKKERNMSPMRDHAYRKSVQTVSSKPTLGGG